MKINVNLYIIFFSMYIFQHYLNRILNSEFSKGIPLIGQNIFVFTFLFLFLFDYIKQN